MFVLMILVGVMLVSVFLLSVFRGSKYGIIGAIRGLAQMISYEILMRLVLIMVFIEGMSYDVSFIGLITYHMPIIFIWWLSCVVETNRSPADFLEGESELVSGFNVEFGSVMFAMLFLGEYGVMAFYSVLTVLMFSGGIGAIVCGFGSLVLICVYIW